MQEVKDIVSAYCTRHDLEIKQGKAGDNDPAPILPFLIMDCAYSEFTREIVPLRMHHNLKQLRKRWLSDYHTFNSRLFHCLSQEQTDFVIDMMDEYEAFIANETLFIKVAVMNLVKGCDFDDQKIIGSLMLCNVFSQVAQIVWGEIFRTPHHHKQTCPELDRMRTISHRLTNTTVLIAENIDPNQDKPLHDSVESYMDKTTKWLKSYDRQ